MILKELLRNVDVVSIIDEKLLTININKVETEISKVEENDLFICIKGNQFDTHIWVLEALRKGAKAIMTNYNLNILNQVVVLNTRYAYAIICQNLYENPSEKLNIIGITGTNGKTSVSYIIHHILERLNINSGLIGTNKNYIGKEEVNSELTTPNPKTLNEYFLKMKNKNIVNVVMEVSSHAIDQERIGNIKFNTAIFTNLTPEHLDYHNNMEQYFMTKRKLFSKCKIACINIDDEYGFRLKDIINKENIDILTYSIKDKTATIYADNIIIYSDCVKFNVYYKEEKFEVEFSISGIYSVYNCLAAFCGLLSIGINLKDCIDNVKYLKTIPGRNETIYKNDVFTIIRDYAHTPDGLKNILASFKEYKKGRVVVLFGCGGNRDKSKRKLMAEIALKNADFVVITSDNPRNENPDEIINDILKGVNGSLNFIVISDRKKAIHYCIDHAKINDIIILAGKGHEDYQIIDNTKYHFDEKEIVLEKINNSVK